MIKELKARKGNLTLPSPKAFKHSVLTQNEIESKEQLIQYCLSSYRDISIWAEHVSIHASDHYQPPTSTTNQAVSQHTLVPRLVIFHCNIVIFSKYVFQKNNWSFF